MWYSMCQVQTYTLSSILFNNAAAHGKIQRGRTHHYLQSARQDTCVESAWYQAQPIYLAQAAFSVIGGIGQTQPYSRE